jgi:hypothetical protein
MNDAAYIELAKECLRKWFTPKVAGGFNVFEVKDNRHKTRKVIQCYRGGNRFSISYDEATGVIEGDQKMYRLRKTGSIIIKENQ